MSLTKKIEKVVNVTTVVRNGDKLILPERPPMSHDEAIAVLMRDRDAQNQVVKLTEEVDAFPWDGAIALRTVLERKLGYAFATGIPEFFGPGLAKEISVEVGHGQTAKAPWGRFKIGGEGREDFLQTDVTRKPDGRMIFQITAVVRRGLQEFVEEIANEVRAEVAKNSIYRAKAVRIRFRDSDGDLLPLPVPQFLDTTINPAEVIFRADIQSTLENYLYTPLQYRERVKALGLRLKRGFILGGEPGVGKSMLLSAVARVGTEAGWTYVHVEKASELPDGILFASQYQPAVVTVEDLDREVSGQRDERMDWLLNTLDGVATKGLDIVVGVTTNHPEKLPDVLKRTGRFDLKLMVPRPDAFAAERLVRLYGRAMIDPKTDLTAVGDVLAGEIPADIREIVERAQLVFVRRTKGAMVPIKLSADDILLSATGFKLERDSFKMKIEEKPALDKALAVIGNALVASLA